MTFSKYFLLFVLIGSTHNALYSAAEEFNQRAKDKAFITMTIGLATVDFGIEKIFRCELDTTRQKAYHDSIMAASDFSQRGKLSIVADILQSNNDLMRPWDNEGSAVRNRLEGIKINYQGE